MVRIHNLFQDFHLLKTTVAGRNPFHTTLKPWETIVCWCLQGNHRCIACWYLQGNHRFRGFLGGAGLRPSTVCCISSCWFSGELSLLDISFPWGLKQMEGRWFYLEPCPQVDFRAWCKKVRTCQARAGDAHLDPPLMWSLPKKG